MGEIRYLNNVLWGNLTEINHLEDLVIVDRIILAQDKDRSRALVKALMKLRVS
jgi:hypothetical protein